MNPFWPALVIFAVLAWTASSYYLRFVRDVERDFPSLWQDIGSPTESRGEESVFDGLGTYWYLYRRRYEKREDIEERKFCEQVRARMLVSFLAALLFFAVFVTVVFVWETP